MEQLGTTSSATRVSAIHAFDSAAKTIAALANDIVTEGNRACTAHGRFNLVLSGGNTPAPLYRLLATSTYSAQLDWHAVHIYFSDERCVPPQDAASNFRMAQDTLIAHVAIPTLQVHRMEGELEPQAAAERYTRVLQELSPERDGCPVFDFVLLGVGNDGHIASLFPGSDALNVQACTALPVFATHLQAWRVTLALSLFRAARKVAVLVLGHDKAAILHRVIDKRDATLPATQLLNDRAIDWYLDRAAAAALTR